MKIAIIGTGNVGGALATKWAQKGHRMYLGVRDTQNFKGIELLKNPLTTAHPVGEAVAMAEVVLVSTPAPTAIAVAQSLGDTTGKILIDSMNIVMGRGPEGYRNTAQAILDHTNTTDLVKCFNTTGYNNMINPRYGSQVLDLFVAGDSKRGKEIARQLALDAGFGACHDIGGNDKFELMEQFAWFWINLAMFQGLGRDIGFALLKR
ncbi:MAG: NAD(P)-binding domain-containing protein [Bacteroidetes bacterium]|nr:NAD(P)-binding domain-containing protein [Bacteroidota bacterium]